MWSISFESEGRGYLNLYRPYATRPAPPLLCKIAKLKTGAYLLKCKKIFYISIDISFVSAYNKCEEMEGGHRNEV